MGDRVDRLHSLKGIVSCKLRHILSTGSSENGFFYQINTIRLNTKNVIYHRERNTRANRCVTYVINRGDSFNVGRVSQLKSATRGDDFVQDFSTDDKVEEEEDENPNHLWVLEDVLDSRGAGETQEVFVRWRNFSSDFDSWINLQSSAELKSFLE